ncbi:hypothetical protein [Streptomyces sp. NPDC006012]|uniref:hypothetical protein n=1 Tax=Streptomyces sp. NPDC006012 TaxID=3364739 RepID=UPI0036C0790F
MTPFTKAEKMAARLGHRWATGEVIPEGRKGLSDAEIDRLDAILEAESYAPRRDAAYVTEFLEEYLKTEPDTSLARFAEVKDVNSSTTYSWAHGYSVKGGRAGLSDEQRKELDKRLKENLPSAKKGKKAAPRSKAEPAPLFGPHASVSLYGPQGQAGDTGFSPSTFPPAPHLPPADSSFFGEEMTVLPNPVAQYANYPSEQPAADASHFDPDLTTYPAAQYADYYPNPSEQPAADASLFGPDSRTLPAPRAGNVRTSDYFPKQSGARGQAGNSRAGGRGRK